MGSLYLPSEDSNRGFGPWLGQRRLAPHPKEVSLPALPCPPPPPLSQSPPSPCPCMAQLRGRLPAVSSPAPVGQGPAAAGEAQDDGAVHGIGATSRTWGSGGTRQLCIPHPVRTHTHTLSSCMPIHALVSSHAGSRSDKARGSWESFGSVHNEVGHRQYCTVHHPAAPCLQGGCALVLTSKN